ncbi:MAG: GapR family DNA-binding domain-containing protein [Pseudomonadota bacterium]
MSKTSSRPNSAAGQTKAFVEKLEAIAEQKKALGDQEREVFAAAKAAGFDPEVMKWVIKRRKKARENVEHFDAQTELMELRLGETSEVDDVKSQTENRGRQDFLDGKRAHENPFTIEDPRSKHWEAGWMLQAAEARAEKATDAKAKADEDAKAAAKAEKAKAKANPDEKLKPGPRRRK